MKGFRIQLLIAFIVLVCCVSLIGLIYMISAKPVTYVTPGVVSVPSPVATPMRPVYSAAKISAHSSMMHHSPYTVPTLSHTPSSAAATSSFGLYMTSSAEVHSVGGGGGIGIVTTSQSASGHGINHNGAVGMPVTNFVALAASRQIAQPEAQEAPQMASMASSPVRRAPGPPNPPGPLPEDHQLVEHPLGDAVLPMLLCAAVYGVCCMLYRLRKRAIKE